MEIILAMSPVIVIALLFIVMNVALYHGSPSRLVYYTHHRSKYSAAVEKRLNLIVGKYHAGMLTVKADEYTLKFSDGTQVWTANKYYSCGYMYGELSNKYPSYKTWREIMRIHATVVGYEDRTIYERLTGKYSTKKKTAEEVIISLDDFGK